MCLCVCVCVCVCVCAKYSANVEQNHKGTLVSIFALFVFKGFPVRYELTMGEEFVVQNQMTGGMPIRGPRQVNTFKRNRAQNLAQRSRFVWRPCVLMWGGSGSSGNCRGWFSIQHEGSSIFVRVVKRHAKTQDQRVGPTA